MPQKTKDEKNPETKNSPPSTSEAETAMTLFGKQLEMMPTELEEMGLGAVSTVKEVPGISPTWKPAKAGDFLIGRVVQVRENVGKFSSTALVLETAVPGGFRTVWLGADLKIKMGSIDPLDKVYAIYYDGTMEFPGSKQPMKVYRVYEVRPKQ